MNSPAKRAIVIGMDGASMELVLRMVDSGYMPNLQKQIERGVHKPMIGVFPTLTPPGWTALMTGSWPGTHGVTDFNIRKPGASLDAWVYGINTGVCKSEYIWNTLERAGKKPILVKYEMSWPPPVTTGVQFEGTGPAITISSPGSEWNAVLVGHAIQWRWIPALYRRGVRWIQSC